LEEDRIVGKLIKKLELMNDVVVGGGSSAATGREFESDGNEAQDSVRGQ